MEAGVWMEEGPEPDDSAGAGMEFDGGAGMGAGGGVLGTEKSGNCEVCGETDGGFVTGCDGGFQRVEEPQRWQ
jgi:hypothetical protein